MEINEPSAIAKLPRIQIDNGRYQFAQVHSIRGGVKRRRQEVCAVADGDSVNIYEVHNGRIIVSCAVPPDTVFTCTPCAIRVQTTESRATKNIYYVSKRRGELTLSLFCDGTSHTHQKSFTNTVTLDDKSPVVQLDTLLSHGSLELLVVREDGSFEVYDDKLSSQLRKGRFDSRTQTSHFLAAQWLSSSQVLKSILKARPDVIATSEPGSSFVVGVLDSHDTEIPGLKNAGIGVWQLPASSSRMPGNAELSPILYHKLLAPAPLVPREQNPVVFSDKGTRLIIKTTSGIYIYDITAMVPRMMYETPVTTTDQISSIPVSDTLILSSASHSLQIHNTLFGTLQSKLNLVISGHKRKRTNPSSGPISFITYFRQISRVLALRRGHLVTIDLQDPAGSGFAKTTKQTSLLVSNIGRGISAGERQKLPGKAEGTLPGVLSTYSEQSTEWQSMAKRLGQCCQNQDCSGLEELLFEPKETDASIQPKHTHVIPEWKANVAISKMFQIDKDVQDRSGETGHRVRLVVPAPKVLEALAFQGFLTIEKIGRALKIDSNSDTDCIRPDQISQILLDCDPSMDLLRKHLKETPHIHRHELCATVRTLLRLALAQSQTESSSMIEDDDQSSSNRPSSLTLGTVLRNKEALPSITACLCTVIQRLSEGAPGSLPSYVRASFQQSDTIALIQFLRQQLFRGGYTRSLQARKYPSPPPSEPSAEGEEIGANENPIGITLSAIATTLSDCIDAIGPIGVLGLGGDEQFVQTLIPELLSEISRATEALQDAAFLQGVLRETLRFAESTIGNHDTDAANPGARGVDVQQRKPGSITTLYSEPVYEKSVVGGLAALPLGLRAEGKIQSYKVRKGDGRVAKRSEREMGTLQERLRGPYALERLIL